MWKGNGVENELAQWAFQTYWPYGAQWLSLAHIATCESALASHVYAAMSCGTTPAMETIGYKAFNDDFEAI